MSLHQKTHVPLMVTFLFAMADVHAFDAVAT